tara:strand:- start:7399 stop:8523 length:1125 start_codon:yes stop_codon:yes gene_type:complete
MKYYIIAGEASGDLHGSNLVKEIFRIDKNASIRAWGGEKMMDAGATVIKNYKDLSFMGFYEVILNLNTILKNIRFCKSDIKKFNPNKIILIDYPGFNLRIAKWAKKNNFFVNFYIAPQIWAWKESRIDIIKKYIDRLYVILPFEKNYFKNKHNYKVKYLGHPIMDSIKNFNNTDNKKSFLEKNKIDDNRKIIAILPGSRKQEIKKILKIMLNVIGNFSDYQFIIAGVPNIKKNFYRSIIKDFDVKMVENQTYDLLSNSSAALVTSGTATLETALFKVPQVVCYKTSLISFFLAKIFVKIKYISLVNLIVDREIIKELVQSRCTKNNIINELTQVLKKRNALTIKKNYDELISLIGSFGTSKRIATDIINKKNWN